MSDTEQDWHTLMHEWQDENNGQRFTVELKLDEENHIKTLAKKVKQNSRTALFETIMLIIPAIVVCITTIVEIVEGLPSVFDYVLYYSLSILFVVVAVCAIWFRRNTWKTQAQDSKDYLQHMLKQNIAATKVAFITKMSSWGFLLTFYGVVLWIFVPSLFAGTLLADLATVAKPVMGSAILLTVTISGILGIYASTKAQRTLTIEKDMLRSLSNDFD